MNRFPPAETKAFFNDLGVELKTERGNRVFPASDRSTDIIDALVQEMRRLNVQIVHGRVSRILTGESGVTGAQLENGVVLAAERVILCTGGASYPATGSTGDGYRWLLIWDTRSCRQRALWSRWWSEERTAERCRAWP